MRPGSVLLLVGVLLAARPAAAVEPDEMLADPALEARARAISQEIRCLVCQNQSIDDSGADLARDLRLLVRERLSAGDSDAQVQEFLVARYGDFVLLRPRLRPGTYVLWFGPPLILVAAAASILWFFLRRRGDRAAPTPLTEAERRHLSTLLGSEPDANR